MGPLRKGGKGGESCLRSQRQIRGWYSRGWQSQSVRPVRPGVRMEDYQVILPDKDINAYLRLIDAVYQVFYLVNCLMTSG